MKWYNLGGEYRFATGMDGPVSFEELLGKYEKIAGEANNFFLGIHNLFEDKLVGILNGKLLDRLLWINLLAIAPEYRGKHFGSMSLDLLLEYVRNLVNVSEAYLAVIEKNVQGRSFWRRNGFCDFKYIKNQAMFDGNEYDTIIMQKSL